MLWLCCLPVVWYWVTNNILFPPCKNWGRKHWPRPQTSLCCYRDKLKQWKLVAYQRRQNRSFFLFFTATLDLFSLTFSHQLGVSQKLLNCRIGREFRGGETETIPGCLCSLFQNKASWNGGSTTERHVSTVLGPRGASSDRWPLKWVLCPHIEPISGKEAPDSQKKMTWLQMYNKEDNEGETIIALLPCRETDLF